MKIILTLKQYDISESICLYVSFITPPKWLRHLSSNFREYFPSRAEGFSLKKFAHPYSHLLKTSGGINLQLVLLAKLAYNHRPYEYM